MASKNALFLHGWPQYNIDNHFLVKHLKEIGYEVFTPNLFLTSSNFTIENIQKEIDKEIMGAEIDLMIGFSFGG